MQMVKSRTSLPSVLIPLRQVFVYLPSYKHNGLLTHLRRGRVWTFVYLEKDVLNTLFFWTPPEIGLTEQSLKKLLDANKITVQQREVQ